MDGAAQCGLSMVQVRDCGDPTCTKCEQSAQHHGKAVVRNDIGYVSGRFCCGRVWTCPWCSAVIGQRRAEELADGITKAVELGMGLYLVLFTIRHDRNMELADQLNVLQLARQRLMQHDSYRRWKKKIGEVGYVKAMEVTASKRSGFHPHFHVLYFLGRPIADNVEFGHWGCSWPRPGRTRWAASIPRCGLMTSQADTAWM